MTKLLANAHYINVFTGEIIKDNILIEDGKIIGVGNYSEADEVYDYDGKILSPGFIDGHIHIESTMMTPYELSNAIIPHGTTSIIADPHEIANVCGLEGIQYMLDASEGLPLSVYFTLSSCVPATAFDESGACLNATDIKPLYQSPRVVGLAEMMNYPMTIAHDPEILTKIADAKAHNKVCDGHAPLLSGKALDSYIACGIGSDHECATIDEAIEKITKGQYIMIREGTAAKNLNDLADLFDSKYSHRCLLCTDDRHPFDIIDRGHIDNIIRRAVGLGKSAVTAIQMASINAATYFGLSGVGAIAPGYNADIVVLDDLDSVTINSVFTAGKLVYDGQLVKENIGPNPCSNPPENIVNTFNVDILSPADFYVEPSDCRIRIIETIKYEIITNEIHEYLNFNNNNGIDTSRNIIKLAVIERHSNTHHIGLGYIKGLGIENGAFASSISHDSHNLIIVGSNEEDMANAANAIIEMGGGQAVSINGKTAATIQLNYAGLMADRPCEVLMKENEAINDAIARLGSDVSPTLSMTTSFVSLTVIPNLKMSTQGLIDVQKFERVSLYVEQ